MKPAVVIVGAGAAGLFAAAHLGGLGRRVIVLERGESPARKVLASGGGRCNFTNDRSPEQMLAALSARSRRFLKPAFHELPSGTLRDWFAARGLPSVVEDRGCVFPRSGRSRDVVRAMLSAAEESGAEVQTGTTCREIQAGDDRIVGVRTDAGDIPVAAVLVACGGPASPQTGGTASGLDLLRHVGHTIVDPRPGLAPLVTDTEWIRPLQGVTLPHARLRCGKHTVDGPLLFAHFGLTGPAALDMSLSLDVLPAEVVLSLVADRTPEEIESQLLVPPGRRGSVRLVSRLAEWVPRRVATEVVRSRGLDAEITLNRLPQEARRSLVRRLTGEPIRVTGFGGWSQAMVTVGGCALEEIEPRTMRSRKVAGLHVAGEVLDVAGPTGGWNLHAAMATGLLAARAIGSDLTTKDKQ
ncbi:MAG: aminoacetone oxidase family FAD-binding enzyme [Planctomycetes bacterium]|nr:aminoacetone oxidase family FAD-binding enzyme [Planctomycetota bacterium]